MNAKPSKKQSATDWSKVASKRDSEIDTSEVEALGADFFASAELRLPTKKKSITVRVDEDVLEWFRTQGKGYQTRMNAVLRMYMEAQMK